MSQFITDLLIYMPMAIKFDLICWWWKC